MRLAAFLVISLAAGCSSHAPAPVDGLVFLDASADVSPAVRVGNLLSSCAGDDCHNHGKGNLLISGARDFSSLMDTFSSEMPTLYRVKRGDPAQSYVYLKLACEGGIVGDCMPQLRPDPSFARIFHDWIEAGAPLP